MREVEVLVVGAGPVGLTAAGALRRRGVDTLIVDRLAEPPQYAKAIGLQPRTLECFDAMGMVGAVLDEAIEFVGQTVYVNGAEVAHFELSLPEEIRYRFFAIPQYATERLLREHLAGFGTTVERGAELTAFSQDADGVTATIQTPGGEETVRAQFLVGADGARSAVRTGLGLDFAGDAFPEEYMLGDVEVDWSYPPGLAVRAMHQTDGSTDDLLVAIPLPGKKRYRMSMLVADDLKLPEGEGAEHGLISDRPGPTLAHIQAVLDRLSPEKTTASELRWSSIFRISHRIVDRYGEGRVFVAGDAAHIHPPTGAQGMNTGIQDAYNLGWKLALATQGVAAPGLTDSYSAERHPVGEEVVGRTVLHARAGFEGDPDDPQTIMLREAQLLVGYPDSPLTTGDSDTKGLKPGARAPDATGLERAGVNGTFRLFDLLREGVHVLLLSTDGDPSDLPALAEAARQRAHGRLRAYAILPPDVAAPQSHTPLPSLHDAAGTFAAAYGPGPAAWLIRPDGYVAHRQGPLDEAALTAALATTFA